MKVLVTGGMGYIGTNLVNFLTKKGVDTVVMDHKNDKDVTEVEGYEIVDEIDYIVHLAAISGIKDCEKDIINTIRDNILAVERVFSLATEHNIPVIFASSGAAKSPGDNLYATLKWLGEKMATGFNSRGGNIKVYRFTNVYGGTNYLEEKSSVVQKFVMRYKHGYPLTVMGDGTQMRDFIHVEDVCEAIYLGLNDHVLYAPIDIGTGIGTTVIQLAKLFPTGFTFDRKSDTIGIKKSLADTRQAENLIGFKAKIKLEDGLNEFIR